MLLESQREASGFRLISKLSWSGGISIHFVLP
jgi:hypothetical protein